MPPSNEPAAVDAADLAAIERQLGRVARGVRRVAHRCSCGDPDVVETQPRLPDGTPFPTLYYVTCPRLTGAIGTLESSGLMKQMQERLADEPTTAQAYRLAHESFLATRTEIEDVPEISGISAGGMPDRVKCLHVLIGHSLAVGPGVNPFGDEALAQLSDWGAAGSCTHNLSDQKDVTS